jgi:hypothetical protein
MRNIAACQTGYYRFFYTRRTNITLKAMRMTLESKKKSERQSNIKIVEGEEKKEKKSIGLKKKKKRTEKEESKWCTNARCD